VLFNRSKQSVQGELAMAETQTTTVYNKIKAQIEGGEYSPAQSLTEAALAQEHGVSRNTIKKALLMLENDGYVTMDLNKGAKVASYSKTEVLQFLELREMLEGFIIRLAVPAFKDAEIKKLGKLLDQMKAYKEAGELLKYSQCNQEFHKIIYAACPNQPAVEVTLRLKNQMKKYNSKTILIPGRSDHSLQEHTEIYEAIRDRDADRAETCIKKHIHNVRDVFDQYYALLF
jgi:DNA-binding GntR family transcriptional regulator